MKRLFTLTLLALLMVIGANAQNYRKWDFSNWSATTVANLAQEDAAGGVTGGSWSSTEKADGSNPQDGNCYWSYANNVSDEGYLMANNQVIAETEGLIWNKSYTSRRSLAIAVNYASTSLGEYAGAKYLWLGGGNAKSASARIACFTIPKVAIGQQITIKAESHKPSDARGVSLFAKDCTDDANQIGESFKPTTIDTYTWTEWTVPDDKINEDGTVDVVVYNTNGCHIYSIEVGSANQKSKIAYLYVGETDAALSIAQENANYQVDAINVSTATLTEDDLKGYDVTIVAASVPADNAVVAVLKQVQPWTPIVNLNPALYAAWEYGTVTTTGSPRIQLLNADHSLFREATIVEQQGIKVINMAATSVQGIQKLAGPFADDEVLAGAFGRPDFATTVHVHNANHNAYVFLPFQNDATDDAKVILANAIKLAAASKAKITPAVKPAIKLGYKNMATEVTISSTMPGATIYYTIDGNDPTTESAVYSEPFIVNTEGITVKAAAIAEGYTLSEVTSQLVDLKAQAAAPVIATDQSDGKTIVTLAADEGDIWYNFSQSADIQKSTKYTGPITFTLPREKFSAFAVVEGKVNSELATADITIQNLHARVDVIAHMDANKEEYYDKGTVSGSAVYYFSWAKDKSTYSFYDPEKYSEEIIYDSQSGDETIVKTYSEMNPEETVDFENGWGIRSRGQLVIWENQKSGENYGDNTAYNYATVEDNNPYFPATQSYLNLADKNTTPSDATFPYNAYIFTTGKYKGPFDVVANMTSAIKPGSEANHEIVFQVSKDGNTWESEWELLGDTIKMSDHQRLTTNVTRSYEGSDEVYVRVYLANMNSKVAFYDIYIANHGTQSETLETGIISVRPDSKSVEPVAVYNLNGRRQNGMQRGVNIVRYSDGTARKVMIK